MAWGTVTDFYLPIEANAGSSMWGTDVRKLLNAAESSEDTSTRTQHGTGGAVDRVEDPYTSSSAGISNLSNYGWAIAPTDMGGASGARRFIPAGNHVLTARVCSEGLVGKSGCILYMYAYRVAAGTYARTLLGSASTTFSTSGLSIYGTVTVTLTLPEIIFEPGETIQYSFYLNAPGTDLVGENYRFKTGHDSSADVKVHVPKLGVLADTSGTSAGAGTASGEMAKVLGCAGMVPATSTVSGVLGAIGGMVGSAPGAAAGSGDLRATGSMAGSADGQAALSGVLTGIGGMVVGSDGAAATVGVLGAIGGMVGDIPTLSTVLGELGAIGSMDGTADGVGAAPGAMSSVAGTVGTADGAAALSGTLGATGAMGGVAEGLSAVSGVLGVIGSMLGTSEGQALLAGALGGIGSMDGSSDGQAATDGDMASLAGTAGQASGLAAVTALLSIVLGTIGTVEIGAGGGGEIIIKKIFTMIDD